MRLALIAAIILVDGVVIGQDDPCPVEICQCGRLSISCVDADAERSDDLLSFITREQYPQLEELTVTGNNFGDLSARHFLPAESAPTESIDNLDLSNNRITKIDHTTLSRLYKLNKLNMSHNSIEYMSQAWLERLGQLKELDLTNALDRSLSADIRKDLVHSLFSFDGVASSLPQLGYVYLDNNGLEYLRPDTFCRLTSLKRLSLADNRLESFEINPSDCQPGPDTLILTNNSIKTISDLQMDIWRDQLIHLRHLDISNNPLHCDCQLKNFILWYKQNEDYNIHMSTTKCVTAEPAHLAGTNLMNVNVDELTCSNDDGGDRSSSSLGPFFWLFFISVACSLICLFYRRRRRQYLQSVAYRGGGTNDTERYAFVGGYHKLNGDSVQTAPSAPPAEFV